MDNLLSAPLLTSSGNDLHYDEGPGKCTFSRGNDEVYRPFLQELIDGKYMSQTSLKNLLSMASRRSPSETKPMFFDRTQNSLLLLLFFVAMVLLVVRAALLDRVGKSIRVNWHRLELVQQALLSAGSIRGVRLESKRIRIDSPGGRYKRTPWSRSGNPWTGPNKGQRKGSGP